MLKWATNSILNWYQHEIEGSRLPSPDSITFIPGYSQDGHIDDYSPGKLVVGMPTNLDDKTLYFQSTALSHELAHHAVWAKFGDWRFTNNGVHFCANHGWVINRAFRRGLLRSYHLIVFDVAKIVNQRDYISDCCKVERGSPQPYWS